MGWDDVESVRAVLNRLQLLADYKYDHYQRFEPGRENPYKESYFFDEYRRQYGKSYLEDWPALTRLADHFFVASAGFNLYSRLLSGRAWAPPSPGSVVEMAAPRVLGNSPSRRSSSSQNRFRLVLCG